MSLLSTYPPAGLDGGSVSQKNIAHVVQEPHSAEKNRRVALTMVQEELGGCITLNGRQR